MVVHRPIAQGKQNDLALAASGLPRHVAIIMDGNGRWANARGLSRKIGHQKGVDAVRRTVRAANEMGIEALTLYGFSSENWKRPPDEVNDLMGLLRLYIRQDVKDLVRQNVRIRVIGERAGLSDDIVALIDDAIARTSHNTGMVLVIAFNYGGQREIVLAARALAEKVKAGEIDPADITDEMLSCQMGTAGLPDPDLVIRTSGEQRLSNFLTWQSVYSELVFQDVLWPDYSREHLEAALREYCRRERRFGSRLTAPSTAPPEPPR